MDKLLRALLAGVLACVAVVVFEIGLSATKWLLVVLALGVAVGVVWGLNWWLAAPRYLILVAVPLSLIAVWPVARMIDRLDKM